MVPLLSADGEAGRGPRALVEAIASEVNLVVGHHARRVLVAGGAAAVAAAGAVAASGEAGSADEVAIHIKIEMSAQYRATNAGRKSCGVEGKHVATSPNA